MPPRTRGLDLVSAGFESASLRGGKSASRTLGGTGDAMPQRGGRTMARGSIRFHLRMGWYHCEHKNHRAERRSASGLIFARLHSINRPDSGALVAGISVTMSQRGKSHGVSREENYNLGLRETSYATRSRWAY